MTLAMAFKELSTQLQTLQEEFNSLRTTIREDKPSASVVFEDTFGDAVDDLLGHLAESLTAVGDGQQAIEQQTDIGRAWRALTTCQEQFNTIEFRFFELVSYDRMAPLLQFGQQRSGEWLAWSDSIKTGLERCWQPIYQLNQALFQCWQDVAERAGMNSVSVQTTNIGQHITLPEGRDVVQVETTVT